MKIKRREILLASAAIAAKAEAQDAPLIDQAREQMKTNRATLEALKVPMAVEPAFVYKV